LTASAIGEGYIAAYHFSNEEYDEAERWYRVALKDLGKSDYSVHNIYGKRYSVGLEECIKRRKG
jgi:hypothetical protein